MTDSIVSISFLPYVMQLYSKPDKPKNHTSIPYITWFCRKSNLLQNTKQHSDKINEGSDKGDLDTQGATGWAVQYDGRQ